MEVVTIVTDFDDLFSSCAFPLLLEFCEFPELWVLGIPVLLELDVLVKPSILSNLVSFLIVIYW